jgi:hypothetical protein
MAHRPSTHPLPDSITLPQSGLTATLSADRFVPGSLLLTIGSTPQSHLHLGDPTTLQFDYIRRMGHIIDLMAPPETPLTALHLGGGALTLPRYIAATRPGSRQQVIEWEDTLIDFVRKHAPLDPSWSIRVRYGDARDTLDRLPPGLRGSVDAIVVDLFAGDHTPAHLTTLEFYTSLKPYLRADGWVLVNIVDGPGQRFAKSQWATLQSLWGFVGVSGEAGVVRGRRFGNLVTMATATPGEPTWWPELQRLGPHPQASLSGKKLSELHAGHRPITDDTAVASPRLGGGFLPQGE